MKSEIVIDATNKKLGRLASQVASSLRGKTESDYLPHKTTFPKVIIKNISKLNWSEKRLKNSVFSTYSGYPGGRKTKSAWEVYQKDPREVFRHAVFGMLPKNKLKAKMIKNLILFNGNEK